MISIVTTLKANAGADSSVCPGNCTTLNAAGAAHYLWSPSSGLNNTMIANPTACPTATTHYTVIVSSGSCTPDSDIVMITVNPAPKIPVISAIGSTMSSDTNKGNQWYLNGAIINGANSQYYTATTTGFYSVCVTNNFGCSSCSAPFTYNTINEVLSNTFKLYPNPNNGIFNIEYTSTKKEIITISNILGEPVYIDVWLPSEMQKNIDMSKIPRGIYIIKLGEAYQKVIVN